MDSNLLRDIDYYMSRQKKETYSQSHSHSPSFHKYDSFQGFCVTEVSSKASSFQIVMTLVSFIQSLKH